MKAQTGIPVKLAACPRLAKQQSSEVSSEALTVRRRSDPCSQSSGLDGDVKSTAGSMGGRRLGASGLARAAVTRRQVAHPAKGKGASTFIQDERGRGGEEYDVWNSSPNTENNILFLPRHIF